MVSICENINDVIFLVMIVVEYQYILALKNTLFEKKSRLPSKNIEEIRKVLMFNEQLYTEIVRTTMMTMQEDKPTKNDFYIVFKEVIEYILNFIIRSDMKMNVFEAWRIVANSVTYGTRDDPNSIYYDIPSAIEKWRAQDKKTIPDSSMHALLHQLNNSIK